MSGQGPRGPDHVELADTGPPKGGGADLRRRLTKTATAKATERPDDTRGGHIAEAVIRLEAIEGGLARVVLGLQDVDTLTSYIELSRIARIFLCLAPAAQYPYGRDSRSDRGPIRGSHGSS